jgi:hypothetical protein
LGPKRRNICHKFYQISFFLHCAPNHVLTAAGVRPDCRLETNLVCFAPTVRSCWEKTRQSDGVQCSRCDKQCSSPFLLRICWEITCQADLVQCKRCSKQYRGRFMLPYLASVQTVLLCRFWLECSHGLTYSSFPVCTKMAKFYLHIHLFNEVK